MLPPVPEEGGNGALWYCKYNSDVRYASCEKPEERAAAERAAAVRQAGGAGARPTLKAALAASKKEAARDASPADGSDTEGRGRGRPVGSPRPCKRRAGGATPEPTDESSSSDDDDNMPLAKRRDARRAAASGATPQLTPQPTPPGSPGVTSDASEDRAAGAKGGARGGGKRGRAGSVDKELSEMGERGGRAKKRRGGADGDGSVSRLASRPVTPLGPACGAVEAEEEVLVGGELGEECSRSIGWPLVVQHRERRRRPGARDALVTSSIITPSYWTATANEPPTAAGSVSSRGSRREHRHFTSTLGGFAGDKGVATSALSFNELKWRKKKLIFGKSAIHSWGLYAAEAIDEGEFVVEYLGEYLRSTLGDARQRNYDRDGWDDYIFRVDDENFVDATKKGGLARFANHSCDGNCESRIITAGGKPRIVLYSRERIEKGEEITYDYKFDRDEDESKRIPCTCGTSKCTGFLN